MKFLVQNYSCLQNPWLGGYRLQIPVLCVLCPQLNLLNPRRTKFLGTPLMWVFQVISSLQISSTKPSCPFLSPPLCHLPSWSDAPFDHPVIQIMKLLIVLFYPSCFNSVPFSARYLSHHSNLEHPWPVTKFHTNLTTDKIVILYVTFWNWSIREYSCQYMTKFVNLLCQDVTVSLSVAACSFSQL